MADIYTSTGIVSSIILGEQIDTMALPALEAVVTIAPLVKNYDLSGAKTKTWSIPTYPTLTASSVGETADLTSTAFTPTDTTVTPTEYGLMTLVTDLAAQTNVLGTLAEDFGRSAGTAIGRAVDKAIGLLFPALNGGTKVGTTATALTVTAFLSGIYTLEASNYQGPMAAVFHPLQVNQLRAAVAASTAVLAGQFMPQQARPNGFCGNLFGLDIYQTTSVGTTNVGTADKAGAIMAVGDLYSPIALGIWRPVRTEIAREATRRAWEVVTTGVYGAAERRDKAGVCVISKGS